MEKMMNILYVGHYMESSGWGQVTRNNILALDSVGFNVVPRAIQLGLSNFPVPDRIKELEAQSPSECSIIIQHVLPHYMKYDSYFRKNIGIFELESQQIQHTHWVDHLNIMDELWVPSEEMLSLTGVKTQKIWLPHAHDTTEYEQDYEPLPIPSIQNKFVFYFIGQYNRRKHLPALLRAFHTEFDPSEPVELILKLNNYHMTPEELAQDATQLCRHIKDNLKLYKDLDKYKAETIITIDLPREELLRLHASCDCFVCPSFGEAWCLPLVDAMAMSNIVIGGRTGAIKDHIKHENNGFLVDGTLQPIFGEHDAIEGFGTARELEFDISILDLQHQMRKAYQLNHVEKQTLTTAAAQKVAEYSFAKIGNRVKELLNV